MIRCPFNNFSKCDGRCPFATPFATNNFAACGLASRLIAIEGKAEGALQGIKSLTATVVGLQSRIESACAEAPRSMAADEPAAPPKPVYESLKDYIAALGVEAFDGKTSKECFIRFKRDVAGMPAEKENGEFVSQKKLTQRIMAAYGLVMLDSRRGAFSLPESLGGVV